MLEFNLSDNNRCVWIGIGTDIPKESNLYAECVSINKLLSEKYGNSILFSEAKMQLPHLNFYDLNVLKKNLDEISLKIDHLVSGIRSFDVKVKSINYFPFGLFFLKIENTSVLSNLHKLIVEAVSPLKENCICEDYLQLHRKYNLTQKSMLKLHGNPYVLSQFIPHVTLGLTQAKNLRLIKKEIRPILTDFVLKVKNIHIVVELDRKKIIMADFDLK